MQSAGSREGCLLLAVIILLPCVFFALGYAELGLLAFVLPVPLFWLFDWVRNGMPSPVRWGFRARRHGFGINDTGDHGTPWKCGWKVADFLSRTTIGRLMVNYRVPEAYRAGCLARRQGTPLVQNPYKLGEDVRSWSEGWRDEDRRLAGH